MKTHDLNQVFLVIGGRRIENGSADGFVTIEWMGPIVTPYEGAQGEMTVSRNNSRGCRVRVSVPETSLAHKILGEQYNAQQLEDSILPRSGLYENSITGERITTRFVVFEERPQIEAGREVSMREWVLVWSEATRGALFASNVTV